MTSTSRACISRWSCLLPCLRMRIRTSTWSCISRTAPLMPLNSQIYNTENLILTVFDDSTLRMPKASHYVAMPSLRLLVKTGFPYTVKSGGTGTLVHVGSNDTKTIASAWMVLAKLAQRHLRALGQALLSFGLPP